jgi:muramoyltetrapeptide carboxypeptidase
MIKAKKLSKGDTIGVISPASPSETPSEIPRAIEKWESLGYKIKLSKNLNKTKGFTAASEEERAVDFNDMVRDDSVDAIFVTQGGYGSAQIIRYLDFDAFRNNPKLFTGFSDITSLHLAINKLAGVVTFHGPGMSRFNDEDLTEYTRKQFFKAVAETDPIGDIPLADSKKWLFPISGGTAEGEIIGGNITLICASLGTPFEIDTRGRILFIEEVETEPWLVDNDLSHLRNAGKFDDVAGIVIGEAKDVKPFKYDPGFLVDDSFEDVLLYYFKDIGVPVLYGLPLGHTDDIATIPEGVHARLDADNKTFTILESGVKGD